MSAPNDGGPAFPADVYINGEPQSGMSLRDWLAGQARFEDWKHYSFTTTRNLSPAEARYAFADAMLKVRKAKQ